jgi:hypothetical protein
MEMAAGPRKPNESFEEYRTRLLKEERETSKKLKGRLFWNSHENGTYVKPRYLLTNSGEPK